MTPSKPRRDVDRALFPFATVMTIVTLACPSASRAGEPLNGLELVASYRDSIESYRRHDPASSAEGRTLVLRAARWDLNLARLAATLAAMPPPPVDTVVRLEGGEEAAGEGRSPGSRSMSLSAATASRAHLGSDSSGGDTFEYARAESQSRLAADDRAAGTAVLGGESGPAQLTASVAAAPQSLLDVEAQLDGYPGPSGQASRPRPDAYGVCLISRFAADCAELLKAAALLHTDVATLDLARGAHERAATHRAIAGWLLWHLPRRTEKAEDDAFVRDWLLAVNILLRSDGSLSSARQLGRLGLARFPQDETLLLSTATATEALTTLCYEADGKPLRSEDCFEIPVAFDAPQPEHPLLRKGQALDQGGVQRETERLLRTLARERPADSEVHLRFGRVQLQRGQAKEARRELRWVIDNSTVTDHVALARLLLGRLAEERKDVQDALDQARAAQPAAPSSQSVRMALARALLASGDRAGAVEVLADLPSKPPKTRDPWAELLLGSMTRFAPARAALYAKVKLQ